MRKLRHVTKRKEEGAVGIVLCLYRTTHHRQQINSYKNPTRSNYISVVEETCSELPNSGQITHNANLLFGSKRNTQRLRWAVIFAHKRSSMPTMWRS